LEELLFEDMIFSNPGFRELNWAAREALLLFLKKEKRPPEDGRVFEGDGNGAALLHFMFLKKAMEETIFE
ncbi:hypothetical protein BX616_005482, partial [Lobosporangium transversale]